MDVGVTKLMFETQNNTLSMYTKWYENNALSKKG